MSTVIEHGRRRATVSGLFIEGSGIMAHLHRFYAPPEAFSGETIELPEHEAHHASRVARVKPGDRVAVFDGAGNETTGRIGRVDRHSVRVAVEESRQASRPAVRVALLQAWLLRDKCMEDIVRRCTELGVGRMEFFRAERSDRPPARPEKWERLAIESCKQCGRLWLPRFQFHESLDAALSVREPALPLLMASAEAPPVPVRSIAGSGGAEIVIGPEGDFTSGEIERAMACGAQPISLGNATLRSEFAAIVASTLALYELGALGPTE